MTRSGHLRRLLIAAAIGSLVSVVVAVGAPQPAGAAPALGLRGGQQVAAPGTAQEPALASSGSSTLVVWAERVDGTFGIFARITSANTDTIGARLTITHVAGHDSVAPDVSWNGSQWLVVWEYTLSSTDHDVYAAFISPSSAVGGRFGISTPGTEQREPAVASSPSGDSKVMWADSRGLASTGWDIWSSSVSTTGTVGTAGRASVDAAGTPFDDGDPDVTWGRFPTTGWFWAWESLSSTETRIESYHSGMGFGARIATGGPALPFRDPAVASNGGTLMVAYIRDHSAVSGGLFYLHGWVHGVDATSSQTILISSASGSQSQPAIAANPSSFLVAWKDTRNDRTGDIYAARVADNGALIDPDGLKIRDAPNSLDRPALTTLAGDPDAVGIAWEEGSATSGGQAIRTFGYGPK